MKFTERQIEILTEYGLPSDQSELTDSQINDIMAIEDMLKYLETTYGGVATFRSFTQGSALNDETLVAEISGFDVTVSRKYVDGKFVYTDNYKIVITTEPYESAIKSYFDEKSINTSVFAEVFNVYENTDDLLSNVNSSNFIFIGADISLEEFEGIVKDYADWYVEKLNGISNSTRFYLVRDVDLLEVSRETYRMCIDDVADENRIMCVISSSGNISLN